MTKDELLNNTHAVAKFSATWCGPCKTMAPIFDEVASRYPNVKVYRIDVDENGDLSSELGIRGIPTVILVKDNKIEKILVGGQSKAELEELFK